MELKKLFKIQSKLDVRIIKEHGLENEDLLPKKILAIEVELDELANATRCFKYWSYKESEPREVILEEYVDCLHFALSIGLDISANYMINEKIQVERVTKQNLIEEFLELHHLINNFKEFNNFRNYLNLLERLLSLGYILGFTDKEITEAYYNKNTINHQRQDQGY